MTALFVFLDCHDFAAASFSNYGLGFCLWIVLHDSCNLPYNDEQFAFDLLSQ